MLAAFRYSDHLEKQLNESQWMYGSYGRSNCWVSVVISRVGQVVKRTYRTSCVVLDVAWTKLDGSKWRE